MRIVNGVPVVVGRFLTVLLTPCLFEMNLNPRYTNLQLSNQVLVAVMSSTGELLQKADFRFISSEQYKCVMMHQVQYYQMFQYFQMS